MISSSSFNSHGFDATQSTASAQLGNPAGSVTGTQLSGSVDSGFSFNGFDSTTNTNANMNGFHLDGAAGSSLTPSLGIVGGESYSNPATTYDSSNLSGVQSSDSTGMAQSLSGIVASNNYNGES